MLELRTTNEIKANRSRVWGYAALFDAPTDLGEFREVVRKGAFRRSLVESSIRSRQRKAVGYDPRRYVVIARG